MLRYEEFKSMITDYIKDYLPEEFAEAGIDIRRLNKNNQDMEGLSLQTDRGYSPVVYLNPLYEEYRMGKSSDEILKKVADIFEKSRLDIDLKKVITPEFMKENVFASLVNRRSNMEMLNNLPYREFQDLAIVYRIHYNESATSLVTKDIQKYMKLSDDELYELAKQNMKKKNPPVIENMLDTVRSLMMGEGIEEDTVDTMLPELGGTPQMYVITNQTKTFGASSVLFDEVLQELSDKVGSDLYLLPSSVHEMLAVSNREMDPYDLAEMVKDVNYEEVSLNDQLSNSVYHYYRDSRELTIAVNMYDSLASRIDEKNYEIAREFTVPNEESRNLRNPGRSR